MPLRGGRLVVPLQSHYNLTTATLQPHYSRITAALQPHYGLITDLTTGSLQPHYSRITDLTTAALQPHYTCTTTPLQLRYNSATIPLHTTKTRNFNPATAFGNFLPDHFVSNLVMYAIYLRSEILKKKATYNRDARRLTNLN